MIDYISRDADVAASNRAFEEMRLYAADRYQMEDTAVVGEVVISRLREIYAQMGGTL